MCFAVLLLFPTKHFFTSYHSVLPCFTWSCLLIHSTTHILHIYTAINPIGILVIFCYFFPCHSVAHAPVTHSLLPGAFEVIGVHAYLSPKKPKRSPPITRPIKYDVTTHSLIHALSHTRPHCGKKTGGGGEADTLLTLRVPTLNSQQCHGEA